MQICFFIICFLFEVSFSFQKWGKKCHFIINIKLMWVQSGVFFSLCVCVLIGLVLFSSLLLLMCGIKTWWVCGFWADISFGAYDSSSGVRGEWKVGVSLRILVFREFSLLCWVTLQCAHYQAVIWLTSNLSLSLFFFGQIILLLLSPLV